MIIKFGSARVWIYVLMIVLGMIWGIRFIYLASSAAR